VVYHADFARVLGEGPRLQKVLEVDAHEGPVYARDEDALYFTTVPRPGSVPAHVLLIATIVGEKTTSSACEAIVARDKRHEPRALRAPLALTCRAGKSTLTVRAGLPS
jgi:hypothetical protein